MNNRLLKLVVLISGEGTNLQAIIDAIHLKKLKAQIDLVISNKSEAYGLERARQQGISAQVVLAGPGMSREDYDEQLKQIIEPLEPDYIVLAGFMKILGAPFVAHFKNKILNMHPSLLPKYPGLNTHQRALESGDKVHGCTVHYVTAELDAGPILGQAQFFIENNDTIKTLQEKTHQLEHALYPEMLQNLWKHDYE
jgi:phosphoribosylglycinamide formyltransferase 1